MVGRGQPMSGLRRRPVRSRGWLCWVGHCGSGACRTGGQFEGAVLGDGERVDNGEAEPGTVGFTV
jgi:hypothetical protein